MSLAVKEHAAYDPLMTTAEAAAYLGMATETLLCMARRREIASVRVNVKKGSPTKFRLSILNNWIRAREIKPLRTPA